MNILLSIVIFVISLAIGSWVVMLLLGNMHNADGRIPDLSFFTTSTVLVTIYAIKITLAYMSVGDES